MEELKAPSKARSTEAPRGRSPVVRPPNPSVVATGFCCNFTCKLVGLHFDKVG